MLKTAHEQFGFNGTESDKGSSVALKVISNSRTLATIRSCWLVGWSFLMIVTKFETCLSYDCRKKYLVSVREENKRIVGHFLKHKLGYISCWKRVGRIYVSPDKLLRQQKYTKKNNNLEFLQHNNHKSFTKGSYSFFKYFD